MRLPDGAVLFLVDTDDSDAAATRAALRAARERLAEHGVSVRDWPALADETPATRLVIDARASLADLGPAGLAAVDAEDGRGRALILVHDRRRLLLRDWQDHVTSGSRQPLEDWLRSADARSRNGASHVPFEAPERSVLDRWLGRLGSERVTVALTCAVHLHPLSALEELAGLESGTIPVPVEGRSLTLAEIEAIRALNDALGSPGARTMKLPLVDAWASAGMASRTPGSEEYALGLPGWVDDRIRDQTAELVAALGAAEVGVIGNLACLSEASAGSADGIAVTADVPSEAAALLAMGVIDGLQLGRKGGPTPTIETRELADVQISRLVAEFAIRPARAVRNAVRLDRDRGSLARGQGAPDSGATGVDDRTANAQLALPSGTRLLHIGPSKTGTTALQGALDRARESELRQGVRYVGWRRHARAAVLQATGTPARTPTRAAREWRAILEELRTSTEPRTVFSAEELAHGDSDFVRRVVDAIKPSDVHVAVTLRPLAKILPSTWQEVVKVAPTTSFEPWLRKVLDHPETAPKFWRSHRHDELINRWSAVVGADRVTAIVLDDRDESSLPRAFEGLLALRPGTLRLHRDRSNRSLTLGEVEAVRSLNARLQREGRPLGFRRIVVGYGSSYRLRLRDPGPDEPRIQLPLWAQDTVAQIARAMAAGIASSGVRVIGDLATLAEVGPAQRSGPVPPHLPPAAAAAMAMGILEAAQLVAPAEPASGDTDGREDGDWIDHKLAAIPMRDLGRVVGRRAQRSAASLTRRVVGSLPRGDRTPDSSWPPRQARG